VHGDADRIVPKDDTEKLVERLQAQKGITVDYENLKGANHFFEKDLDTLDKTVGTYLDRRISEIG
jgi:alpha/beta superfamily hydrolase